MDLCYRLGQIVELPLAAEEQEAFAVSVCKIREDIKIVDEELERAAADDKAG